MKFRFLLLILLFPVSLIAQELKLEEYGLRHFQTPFRNDPVDILVQSLKGEEKVMKPVILIERGSLPRPLLIHSNGSPGGIMPFRASLFTKDYHLVYVNKPFTPLISEVKELTPDMTYVDPKTGAMHLEFVKRDLPEYYAARDLEVIRFLKKQPWVDQKKLVLAGHSEGGAIVARVAAESKAVTHVIYSNENPLGRMMTIISGLEAEDDSVGYYTNQQFDFWKLVVEKKDNTEPTGGNTHKNIYDFSASPLDYLQKLKQPVLVTYGLRDPAAPFNNYLRLEMIRQKKDNFSFIGYEGLEHNYFAFDAAGKVIVDMAGWNQAAQDWLQWLSTH